MPTDLDELRKRLTTPPQYTKQPTFTSGDALELIDRCERAEQELKETYAHWSREVGPSSQCKHPSICIDHEGECGWCRAEQDTRRLDKVEEMDFGMWKQMLQSGEHSIREAIDVIRKADTPEPADPEEKP